MLKYLKEDNRCYYVATTILSLGVAYFVKKLFSANKRRLERLMGLRTEETANVNFDIASNSNEESSIITKCEADFMKLSSKAASYDCKVSDSLIASPEQEAVSLNISASVHQTLPSEITMSEEEILPLTAPTSDFESLTSVCKISPSETYMFEPQMLPTESSKSEIKNSPSMTSYSEYPMEDFENLPSVFSIPELENVPSESSMIEHKIFPADTSMSENKILPTGSSEPVTLPSVSHVAELENLPLECSMTELGILPSVSPKSEHEILPLETELKTLLSLSTRTEPGNLPSMSPVPELQNLLSGSLTSKNITLLSETLTLENKTIFSNDEVLVEQQNESVLHFPVIQSQSSEKSVSTLSPSPDVSSRILLLKAENESLSLEADEVLVTLLQNSKQEITSKFSVEKENNILSNGLIEKGNNISLTNSNTEEFSLDTIPLEMIYKILPMSMR